MRQVHKATRADYKRIVCSLNRKPRIDYITVEHVKLDLQDKNLYTINEQDKILAIFSIIYDSQYNMYYLKRLTVLNKKNYRTGLAQTAIRFATSLTNGTLAITPWKDNLNMQNLLNKLGFTYRKTFLENYTLYTKEKVLL